LKKLKRTSLNISWKLEEKANEDEWNTLQLILGRALFSFQRRKSLFRGRKTVLKDDHLSPYQPGYDCRGKGVYCVEQGTESEKQETTKSPLPQKVEKKNLGESFCRTFKKKKTGALWTPFTKIDNRKREKMAFSPGGKGRL